MEVSPGCMEVHQIRSRALFNPHDTHGAEGRDGPLSRGAAELIREGWKRDFPNARQAAEPNVIMRGEDFIMGRGTP